MSYSKLVKEAIKAFEERNDEELETETEPTLCPYQFYLDEEEKDAMSWLLSTLEKVIKRGGDNADRAGTCKSVLFQMVQYEYAAHARLHEFEAALKLRQGGKLN